MNINSMLTDNFFKTKDLGEAASLVTAGLNLAELQKSDDGKFFFFLFDDKTKAEILSQKYWSGKLRLDAHGLLMARRSLQDRLFRNRNENGGKCI